MQGWDTLGLTPLELRALLHALRLSATTREPPEWQTEFGRRLTKTLAEHVVVAVGASTHVRI